MSRNTEVDLFTHTEIKPTTSTGDTTATFEPEATFELAVAAGITGTVVLTALVTFLFFGLTGTVDFAEEAGEATEVLVADAVALASDAAAPEAPAGTVVAVTAGND